MKKEFNGRYGVEFKSGNMEDADCHAMKVDKGKIYFYYEGLAPRIFDLKDVKKWHVTTDFITAEEETEIKEAQELEKTFTWFGLNGASLVYFALPDTSGKPINCGSVEEMYQAFKIRMFADLKKRKAQKNVTYSGRELGMMDGCHKCNAHSFTEKTSKYGQYTQLISTCDNCGNEYAQIFKTPHE